MHLWRAFEHDVCKRRALQPHCFSARGPTAQRSIRLLPRMDTISYPYMYKVMCSQRLTTQTRLLGPEMQYVGRRDPGAVFACVLDVSESTLPTHKF